MIKAKNIIPFILAFVLTACDWHIPTSDEGLVSENISVTDSFAAKGDGLVINEAISDSIMKVDNAQNKDTLLLPPTKGIDTKNVNPEDLISYAETLMGVPYVWGSTNPSVGFDCSGFITHVFNKFKISVPRSSIDFTNVGKVIPVHEARRGDIILFTGTNPLERFVGHMGLIVSNADTLKFIHSTSGKAMSVTVTPLSDYYKSRFVKTIRIFPENDSYAISR